MGVCTRRVAAASSRAKATSLGADRADHAAWCRPSPRAREMGINRLAERDDEPRDQGAVDGEAEFAPPPLRVAPPRIAGDERVAVATEVQDVELVVGRPLPVGARDLVEPRERADGNALEAQLGVVGELLEHRAEVARADAGVEPLHVPRQHAHSSRSSRTSEKHTPSTQPSPCAYACRLTPSLIQPARSAWRRARSLKP